MKAHFANDECENEPFEVQIDKFKNDSEKMEVLSKFIEDVIKTAEIEAQHKKTDDLQQTSGKEKTGTQSFTISALKNGKVNRAKGFVVRLFDAICNCANSATAPAQRMRRKRSSQSK